jgi:outer membrane lipoprotein-sorting protein
MRCRSVWLVLSLSPVLCLSAGLALAEDTTTTVQKITPATGSIPPQDALRPAQDLQQGTGPAAAEPYDAAVPEPGDAAQAPGEINPSAGDEGAGWDAAVEATPSPTPLIGAEQAAAVQRINAYFNGITNLQGTFEQVDSNNKHATGRFYVQRPGKLRFDYAAPSTLRIVADGHFLAIEDSDLKTIEKYPLESTPFRLLLGDGVDLSRDARIVGVEQQEGSLAVTLEDKNGAATGQIKLNFSTEPELKLKQWVITDAQGLATSVTVDDVVPGRKVAADFFNATVSFEPFQ